MTGIMVGPEAANASQRPGNAFATVLGPAGHRPHSQAVEVTGIATGPQGAERDVTVACCGRHAHAAGPGRVPMGSAFYAAVTAGECSDVPAATRTAGFAAPRGVSPPAGGGSRRPVWLLRPGRNEVMHQLQRDRPQVTHDDRGTPGNWRLAPVWHQSWDPSEILRRLC